MTAFAKNATGTFDVTLEYTQTFKARVELAVLVAAVASIAPHLQFCFEKGKDGIYELTSAERD
ncbi:MAG: hypothetical protein C5B49_12105 [Bdellovibrio sp.]|nr:MAG: hypothetical protein C5B49_12105 [Bdellovibrio sp.]